MRRALWLALAAAPWLALVWLPGPTPLPQARALWCGAWNEVHGRPGRAAEEYRVLVDGGVDRARPFLSANLRFHASRLLDERRPEAAAAALEAIEESLRLMPGDLHGLLVAGLASQQAGRPAAALAWYDRLSERWPAATDGPLAAANLLWLEGRHEEADERYREAMRRAPASGLVRLEMAEARLAAGEIEAAGRLYEEALRLEPRCAACRLHRARFLRSLGRDHEALQEARAALQLSPTYPEALAFVRGQPDAVRPPPVGLAFGRDRVLFDLQRERAAGRPPAADPGGREAIEAGPGEAAR